MILTRAISLYGDSVPSAIAGSSLPQFCPLSCVILAMRISRLASGPSRDWLCWAPQSPSIRFFLFWPTTAKQVRERAATNLARSGMLTGEQRLGAVPQLLNLLDDDSLEPATQDLVCAALRTITGASFGRDPASWRGWWAHHDRPETRRVHVPKGLLLA